MKIAQYMQMMSDVELEGKCAISVVVLRNDGEDRKEARYIVCTKDNLPYEPTSIVMKTLAFSVVQVLGAKTGSIDNNMTKFLKALQDAFETYMKNKTENVVNECKKLINQK